MDNLEALLKIANICEKEKLNGVMSIQLAGVYPSVQLDDICSSQTFFARHKESHKHEINGGHVLILELEKISFQTRVIE